MSLSSCLLYGIGISGFSTGLYAILNDTKERDKKEYNIIFCITLIVSILVLYITSGDSKSIIPLDKSTMKSTSINNTPPF